MKLMRIVAAVLALSLGEAAAQQGLRDRLVGTWTFVVAEVRPVTSLRRSEGSPASSIRAEVTLRVSP